MSRVHLRIALSGAVWFAFIAGFGLPLLTSAYAKPLAAGSAAETIGMVNVSLGVFGAPAALVGFALANPISRSTTLGAFCLGAAQVLGTNILAGVLIAALNSRLLSLHSFVESAFALSAGFLLLDTLAFKGAPFLLGGFAALAFRAGTAPRNEA